MAKVSTIGDTNPSHKWVETFPPGAHKAGRGWLHGKWIRPAESLVAALLILSVPSLCSANPPAASPWPLIVIPALLVIEGIVIITLAKRSEGYRLRFTVIWFFITLFTFTCLDIGTDYVASLGKNTIIVITTIIVGECIVMIVEGAAIWGLLRWRLLARNLSAAPSFPKALLYSFIANVISIAGGLLSSLILPP